MSDENSNLYNGYSDNGMGIGTTSYRTGQMLREIDGISKPKNQTQGGSGGLDGTPWFSLIIAAIWGLIVLGFFLKGH